MKTAPIALWLWYRGDRFRGWQRQAEGPTVQEALEGALAASGYEAAPAASGRTDRGVHARMQVVSLRPKGGADPLGLRREVAARLPEGMGLAASALAPPAFHAQWSATQKEYRYRLALGPHPPARWEPFAWAPAQAARLHAHIADPAKLDEALRRAEGTRDFIAFHEKSSPQKPRRLERCRLEELGEGVFEARLVGEGFARYQVRYLVGTAVAVAAGRFPREAYERALDQGAEIAGTKAPAHGLILWEVRYPAGLDPFGAAVRQAPEVPDEPPFAA